LVQDKNCLCQIRDNPKLVIYRDRDGNEVDFVKVFESEYMNETKFPIWNPIMIRSQLLCNGDYTKKLKFEVISYKDNGSHYLYGYVIASIKEI
jgi:hypothetical protein